MMEEQYFCESVPAPNLDKMLRSDKEYTRFEAIYAWLCVLLGYFICRTVPISVYTLGCFLVVCASCALSVVSLVKKGIRINRAGLFPLVAALGFGVSFITSGNQVSLFLSVLGSVICYCLFIYFATGNSIKNQRRDFILYDIYRAMTGFSADGSKDMVRIMFSGKRKTIFIILKVLAGICVAVIPTAIIIALLSFDENFSSILGNIGELFDNFDLLSHIFSLAIGFLIGIYLFGLYKINTEERFDDESDKRADRISALKFAPALTVVTALLPIVVVYIIFFVSQWDYYLSGFSGVLPEGVYNYAEYARDGFFELCCVSAINLLILVAVGLFLKRREKATEVIYRCVNLVFSGLTLVLIGTALSKMKLYIDVYGLTEKRVLSTWFMLLLTMLFVAIIVAQFVRDFKLLKASAIIVCCASLLISLVDYRAVIANYNVDKFISGEIKEVRVSDLWMLGDSAVPATVELLEYYESNMVVPSYERDNIVEYLRAKNNSFDEKKGLLEFSIPKHRASEALDDYFAE